MIPIVRKIVFLSTSLLILASLVNLKDNCGSFNLLTISNLKGCVDANGGVNKR